MTDHHHPEDKPKASQSPAALQEWQKHIADQHADSKGKAWCGAALAPFDWAFADIDHAAMTARNGGRQAPCPACLAAVQKAFGALTAAPQQPSVGGEADYKGHNNLAEMLLAHTANYRKALKFQRGHAKDADDRSWFDHELSALDDIETAAKAEVAAAQAESKRLASINLKLLAALEYALPSLGFEEADIARAAIALAKPVADEPVPVTAALAPVAPQRHDPEQPVNGDSDLRLGLIRFASGNDMAPIGFIASASIKAADLQARKAKWADDGWLVCDGGLYSGVDYPELYAVVAEKYGRPDLPNQAFNVPNTLMVAGRWIDRPDLSGAMQ